MAMKYLRFLAASMFFKVAPFVSLLFAATAGAFCQANSDYVGADYVGTYVNKENSSEILELTFQDEYKLVENGQTVLGNFFVKGNELMLSGQARGRIHFRDPRTLEDATGKIWMRQGLPTLYELHSTPLAGGNKELLMFLRLRIPQQVILAKIRTSSSHFDSSPGALKFLREAGVSEQFLDAVIIKATAGVPAGPKKRNLSNASIGEVLHDYMSRRFADCNGNTFSTHVDVWGTTYFQFKNVRSTWQSDQLSQADNLNGIQWRGRVYITADVYRRTLETTGKWGGWSDNFRDSGSAVEQNGNWEIVFSGNSFYFPPDVQKDCAFYSSLLAQ